MEKVFFKKIDSSQKTKEILEAAKEILSKLDSGFKGKIPLKVHFGESGCTTYVKSENYQGIIDYLNKQGAKPFYTDTNVLYRGERMNRDTHIALAEQHGFTNAPIEIADGVMGEAKVAVPIKGKWFDTCSVGKVIADSKQMVVLAHFKGHMLAGFGGAIKQLGMGCASREGKLAMHAQAKPFINPIACTKCMVCVENCPVDACVITKIPHIDKNKCVGCAVCIAVCDAGAVKINWLSTSRGEFLEKLAEYALAAQKGKKVSYINFVFDITKGCDCEGHSQKPIMADLGVLGSTDPVALDKACFDLLSERKGKKVFGGEHVFEYAEKIGLGSTKYELVEL